MNYINIYNETNEKILFINLMEEVLDYACKKENINNSLFNIIIVNNSYIHKLNKEYRNIDKETDVISFALEDEKDLINGSNINILGDIYISIDKAKEQSISYNHSLKRELLFLAVHGFYHLLGYDHQTKEEEKIMFQKQEEVLEANGIRREG